MSLLLISSVSKADFNGFPFGDGTNGETWYEVNTNFGPFTQLWFAANERFLVAPIQTSPSGGLNFQETLQLGVGSSNLEVTIFVTNGPIVITNVFTNVILLISNRVQKLSLFPNRGFNASNETSDIGPFDYTFNDPIDGSNKTETAFPALSANLAFFMDDLIYTFFDDDNDEFTPCQQFVVTNEKDSGVGFTFNDWYSTAGTSGVTPEAPPFNSFVGLLFRESIGFTTNRFTNEFGLVQGTNNSSENALGTDAQAWFTKQPDMTNIVLMAELHFTNEPSTNGISTNGAWKFIDIGTFSQGYAQYESTEQLPLITYTSFGTNPIVSVSVTITGRVLTATNLVPASGFDYRALSKLSKTTEVVTVSSSNTALTLPWYDIEDMTNTALAGNVGDVMSVVWTNKKALYLARGVSGEVTTDRPWRLYFDYLDERAKAFTALTLTQRKSSPVTIKWTADGETNVFRFEGISSNSLAEAKSIAQTNIVASGIFDNVPPFWGTSGRVDELTNFTVQAFACKAKMVWSNTATLNGTNVATLIDHTVDVYYQTKAIIPKDVTLGGLFIDETNYNNFGDSDLTESNFHSWALISFAVGSYVSITSDFVGGIGFPPSFFSGTPTTNNSIGDGFMQDGTDGSGPLIREHTQEIEKWDFQFK